MAQNITLLGASYSDVPAVQLPKTGGGTATFTDVTDTTAAAADVASGKYFYTSGGTRTQGTASGGSLKMGVTTWNNSSTSTVSHQFTGLSGTPVAAVLRCTAQLTRSSNNAYYYIAVIIWDGTNCRGNYHLRSNGSFNNQANYASNTGYSVTTANKAITFSSSATSRSSAPGSFYNGAYELTYFYL